MISKKGRYALYAVFIIIIALCLYMIQVGTNGLALTPRKEQFMVKQGSVLKTDPGYYFKGVTDPDRVKMDLSKVDTKKPGTYLVQAKQSSRKYEFHIKVTE